ncbi:MAG: Peptidase M23B [uncultured Corynebacteriales bacterium]|uniref:Peptidase M23B n=1 Tax=uncultured Mycobacteriales bacterium TaxID=581187 RepID=A0A6J4I3Y7_9ACTN|nr:MAG: Peptidase M23B [uncultured Corynebacteriales bacterium]
MRIRWAGAFGIGVLTVAGILLPASPAAAAPTFKVPFGCGQVWSGQTRTSHSPANAVDFNRADDQGDAVRSSAAGTVSTVRNLGDTSYGRYVVVDHGSGYSTLYAHLQDWTVSVGQSVGRGTIIGHVGSTGGSSGPHLHYEQRLNGSAIRVAFNGVQALYWGTRDYTSDNGCSSGGGVTATVNTAGTALTVRSGPGTGYAAVGTVSDGQTVTIGCQTSGSSVTGTYGTSTIWDRIGSGRYIADAYVSTGHDGYIPGVPRC